MHHPSPSRAPARLTLAAALATLVALAAPRPAWADAPPPAPSAVGRLGRGLAADAVARAAQPASRRAGAQAALAARARQRLDQVSPGLRAALLGEDTESRARLRRMLSPGLTGGGGFTMSDEDRRALTRGLEALRAEDGPGATGLEFLHGEGALGPAGGRGGMRGLGVVDDGGSVGVGGLGGPSGYGGGPRADTRETTPAPTAQVALTVSARGPLQQETVRRILLARRPALRRCYEAGLRRRSGLAGTLAVRATVTGAGVVHDLAVTTDGAGDQELAECVVGVLRRAAFRPADGDTQVELSVSFTHDVR